MYQMTLLDLEPPQKIVVVTITEIAIVKGGRGSVVQEIIRAGEGIVSKYSYTVLSEEIVDWGRARTYRVRYQQEGWK